MHYRQNFKEVDRLYRLSSMGYSILLILSNFKGKLICHSSSIQPDTVVNSQHGFKGLSVQSIINAHGTFAR